MSGYYGAQAQRVAAHIAVRHEVTNTWRPRTGRLSWRCVVPSFASSRPTLWTCRPVTTIPQHELLFAMRIFKTYFGRGDFYLA
jgi:hypothetical protein